MQKDTAKIGILGGTFNPVHCGHLLVAEAVREAMCLDRVIFVPVGMPPHKPTANVIESEHRYNMVKCAVGSNPFFEASPVEIDRDGYTYTIDTIKVLKDKYIDGTQFFFIIGADVVHELNTWKNYKKVFEMSSFIAILRPDYNRISFEHKITELKENYRADIITAEAPLIGISSTNIRERVSSGKTIKYMVPECVESYIIENRLYKY